jgi:hypothetical protein
MPIVSYDSKSLMIDNRRVWLVSGSIQYARIPQQQWRSRLRAAKQAGLNCIETFVHWHVHEPKKGKFKFEGDLDLRLFVQMVGEEGMYCILRPGPYINADSDNGGLPAWLNYRDIKLRQGDGGFLEASSRFYSALMEQVSDLQVTSTIVTPSMLSVKKKSKKKKSAKALAKEAKEAAEAAAAAAASAAAESSDEDGADESAQVRRAPGGGNGPILLMQIENEWHCRHPKQGEAYLRELARYLMENGCKVPIIENNQLWQDVAGVYSSWSGHSGLLENMRQLRPLQKEAGVEFPLFQVEYYTGSAKTWQQGSGESVDAVTHLRHLAELVASGAQYNVYPFHAGTNFGFQGGRAAGSGDAFVATSPDYGAPLAEAGQRTDGYAAIKRISTFASHFGWLLSHLEIDARSTIVSPDGANAGFSVVHQTGSQGDLVMVFRGQNEKANHVELTLPDGVVVDVPVGSENVAWLVTNAQLGGVAELTYSNLQPWALVDRKVLVVFGPAGSEGVVCIDGAPTFINVPTGKTPNVEVMEDITVVALNTEQLDATYISSDQVYVGVSGLDENDAPYAHPGFKQPVVISTDGEVTRVKSQAVPGRKNAPSFGAWSAAGCSDLVDGTSETYKEIDAPKSLGEMKQSVAYGWYKFNVKGAKPATNLMAPQWSDRVHIFAGGATTGLIGQGADATSDPAAAKKLGLGDGEVVALADTVGRFSSGWRHGEAKGVAGQVYEVKPLKLGTAKVGEVTTPDPTALTEYLEDFVYGTIFEAGLVTWEVKPAGRQPMIVEINELPCRAMVVVNDVPLAVYDPALSAGHLRILMHVGEQITGGKNQLALHLFEPLDDSIDLRKFVDVYQTTGSVTSKGTWSFAKWAMPKDSAFEEGGDLITGQPAWHRSTFSVTNTAMPLWFEPHGLSKGQLFINGHNAGRYWNADAAGKEIGSQSRYYLPEGWLNAREENVLTVFDEHGLSPSKCKLVYAKG